MAVPYQRKQKQKLRNQQKQEKKLQFNHNSNLDILRNKPFWIFDKQEHLQKALVTKENCCLNHIIGLPTKNGKEMPMFDYEKLLFDALQEHKHIWILKATGLGITEFFLRYIAWKCLFNDDLKGSHICLITGPRIELAITLIDRLKKLFHKLNVYSENKETVLILNQVRIEAFPSHHLNTMRGLPHVSFILLDEGDFLPKGEQQEVRDVIERYIGKSNPHIVLVSTPNSPTSLFAQIDKEDPSIYHKLKLDYTFGLGKIYTPEEIEEAKKSISFPREYDLQFLGLTGNTFHNNDIQRAVDLGSRYDSDLVQQSTQKVLGIDPGWGSSAFGLCLLEFVDGVIHVRLAEEYERPRYEEMIAKILDILQGLNQWSINQEQLTATKVYIDAANPEFISSLKRAVGEDDDWQYISDKIQYCKKYNLEIANEMTVIPVPFSTEGKNMIIHTKELMEYQNRQLIAIHPKYDKLIVSLRTAQSDDQGKLDKESTSYHNVLDAFRLALRNFKIKSSSNKSEPLLLQK